MLKVRKSPYLEKSEFSLIKRVLNYRFPSGIYKRQLVCDVHDESYLEEQLSNPNANNDLKMAIAIKLHYMKKPTYTEFHFCLSKNKTGVFVEQQVIICTVNKILTALPVPFQDFMGRFNRKKIDQHLLDELAFQFPMFQWKLETYKSLEKTAIPLINLVEFNTVARIINFLQKHKGKYLWVTHYELS